MAHRTAWITLRHQPPYRAHAFFDGLEAVGFKPKLQFPGPHAVQKDDVVVVWNLNPRYRDAANQAKMVDAPLLVVENGYVPRAHAPGDPVYAIARNGHNGSGLWFVEKEDRWSPLGQTIHPWVDRPDGYFLIIGQRGIGSETMRSPSNFLDYTATRVRKIMARSGTKRKDLEIRFRQHPGRHKPTTSLNQDLSGARAVITWASNVANEALLQGIPAFRCAPYHVNDAVIPDLSLLADPPKYDRLKAFKKLAWAQWFLEEIKDGTAFRSILRDKL